MKKKVLCKFKEVCDDLYLPTSYEQSQEMGLNFFMFLEYSSIHNGYMIWRVCCRSCKQTKTFSWWVDSKQILEEINNLYNENS